MNKNKGTVLIAAPVHHILINGLAELGYCCINHEKITQQTAPGLIYNCTGVVTSTRLLLDKKLLDAAPQLKWIGRMGSGMEIVDVPYAAARGIRCYSSPEGNCNAVGEHALGMLLSVIRRIPWSSREMLQGIWLRDENRGTELEGKTIGIIGFGHTGRAFAKKLIGFDMKILAYDKYLSGEPVPYVHVCKTIDEIYENADIVSFHVPLQEDTIHYLNDEFVSKMKKPFILVNTSRGQVVATNALYRGFKNQKIIAACLDVFEKEPIAAMNPEMKTNIDELIVSPSIITTPHIAGYTYEALYKMSSVLLKKIKNEQ